MLRMKFRAALIVCLLATVTLAGCGSKGALYLPGHGPNSGAPAPSDPQRSTP
jgi:predicted small lipoprotein YifL